MSGILGMLYGFAVYAFFFATLLYTVGFVGDVAVSKTIDSREISGVGMSALIDLALLTVFAVQHSVMARRRFKRWWTTIVPQALERSTYVLAATAALALLIWQWRPILLPVWEVENSVGWWVLTAAFWFSWGLLLFSTFLLNHFELFGLRQVYCAWQGKEVPRGEFKMPLLYKLVRHPIYLSFLIAFWATPRMTVGHLLLAAGAGGYILLGAILEEHDLVAQFGDVYRQYQQRVPMLVPVCISRSHEGGGSEANEARQRP